MRPSAFTDGNLHPDLAIAARAPASMRPSAFTDGNSGVAERSAKRPYGQHAVQGKSSSAMTSEVNDARYLAGDLSRIQRFRAAREDRATRRLMTLVRCAVNAPQPQSSTTKTMTTTRASSHCASCFNARSIGAQLTRRQWILAGSDSSYRQLRSFSRDLHAFFSERVQQTATDRWLPIVHDVRRR